MSALQKGCFMSVTIRDVAEHCGFSIATISRALSNSPTVKAETREKIIAASEELGYKYAPHVRKESKAAPVITLVVGDIMNLFYLGIIKGINDCLNENDIKLAIYNSDYDPAREEEFVRYANEQKSDGIIMITATETSGLVSLLKTVKCPVVLANRYIRSMDLDAVCIDNYRGGYMAGSYLAEHGHRRIAHLAGPANSTASQDRERGFLDAMEDHHIELQENMIYYGNLKRDSGAEFAEYFLSELADCTAVFSANDLMAAAFCEKLLAAGRRVPDDVSVICFDDSTAAVSGDVKLTTISRDPYPMGRAAAEMMVEALKGVESRHRKILFPPVLSVRDSVAALATEQSEYMEKTSSKYGRKG
ncbi:MAG: LacI family DNA-binding transcriptional regulator [Saccharofermentanales bacterium]|jgi:LacI family transcriptional regulator